MKHRKQIQKSTLVGNVLTLLMGILVVGTILFTVSVYIVVFS